MKILNIAHTNIKEILLQMVKQIIDDKQLSIKEAAHVLQTTLADISYIKMLRTASFSLDRLLIFLVRLDCKVTIVIDSKEAIEQTKSFEFATSAS